MAACLIGIDIGTMGTKTGIYDEAGLLKGEAFEESILSYPKAGWVEQHPEHIYGSAVRTIRLALEASGVAPNSIAALALTGQMAGVSTVDLDWNAPTHYDSWLDNRCAPYVAELQPYEDEILQKSGCTPSYNHGPKMLYWRAEHPEVWQRIAKFVPPSVYVSGRLAGLRGENAFLDRTYLNFTTFADTKNACWNTDLLGRFDLDTTKLPRIVEPWDLIGSVTPDAAAATGLREGTPIAAGCGDQAANVFGAGIVEPGTVFDTAGTASVFSTVIDRWGVDSTHKALMTCAHVVPGLYYPMAYVAGGGLNLRWFRDEFCAPETRDWIGAGLNAYDELGRLAAGTPAGADKLVFVPHLGGRNTPNNTAMRGMFVGLTWKHGKGHMVRAIMESIGYEYALYLRSVRELAPDIRPTRALSIGGGAKSAVFRQIKADILGLSYQGLDRVECGTWGAAMVAGKAVGIFDDLSATAQRTSRPAGDAILPRSEHRALYDALSVFYAELLQDKGGLFSGLAAIDVA